MPIKWTRMSLSHLAAVFKDVVAEFFGILNFGLEYLLEYSAVASAVNVLFTYHMVLSLALVWCFFLNIVLNLCLGLFLLGKGSSTSNHWIEDFSSFLVLLCTFHNLYSFERHLYILGYGSWTNFPQWRTIARETQYKYKRRGVRVSFALLLVVFGYSVISPLFCLINKTMPIPISLIQSLGENACASAIITWDPQVRSVIQVCCFVAFAQLGFSLAFFMKTIERKNKLKKGGKDGPTDRGGVNMVMEVEGLRGLQKIELPHTSTCTVGDVTRKMVDFSARGSKVVRVYLPEHTGATSPVEDEEVLFMKKLKALGVGIVLAVFVIQTVVLGYLTSFTNLTLHAVALPLIYAFGAVVIYLAREIISCHQIVKHTTPFSPALFWFTTLMACGFVSFLIATASKFEGLGCNVMVFFALYERFTKMFYEVNNDDFSMFDASGEAQLNRNRKMSLGVDFGISAQNKQSRCRTELYRFLVVMFAIAAGIALMSFFQASKNYYPSTMGYSADENHLNITQAVMVKLNLETTHGGKKPMEPPVEGYEYSICTSSWNDLDIIDYALLSTLAYFDMADPLEEIASHMFPSIKGIRVTQPFYEKNHQAAQFLDISFPPPYNLSVIAVRGTDVGRTIDLLEDAKLWVEPVVFNTLSMVFPTMRFWNDQLINNIIAVFTEGLHFFGLEYDLKFYKHLVDYTDNITDRKVVVTGHSLGGGLAQIVGALTNTTAVAYSPPGIIKSRYKLSLSGDRRVTKMSAFKHSISIVPESDFVTGIDTMSGLVQAVICNEEHSLACHMVQGTLCELLRSCGDARGRFAACNYKMEVKSLFFLVGDFVDVGGIIVGCIVIMALYLVMMHPLASVGEIDNETKKRKNSRRRSRRPSAFKMKRT